MDVVKVRLCIPERFGDVKKQQDVRRRVVLVAILFAFLAHLSRRLMVSL